MAGRDRTRRARPRRRCFEDRAAYRPFLRLYCVAALACRDWQGSADAFVQVRSGFFAWREMDFELSVPVAGEPVYIAEGELRVDRRGSQKNFAGYRGFESISLQQTVRVSPRPGRYRSKNPRFRAGVRRCGRQRHAVASRDRANRRCYLCRAIFQYRSAADVIGQRRPRPSQSCGSGQFLKQSRAGRVARARPAADVSGRAACLP